MRRAFGTGTTGDRRIVIAVLDTGVAPIPELRAALVPGWDFVDGDATPQDTFGHGTWVASAIAAQGNNRRFGAGYCWGCGLMPVRVSDGHVAADTAVIARAIRWAVDHGARVITISLTGQGDDPAERAAVEYAAAHNVLVVASAGNSGADEIEYPAAYPSVLSVAGTDPRDRLYPWSTRGAWVSLAAPGCATVVHVVIGAAVACGSSFAPPAVAGIAGLCSRPHRVSVRPESAASSVRPAGRSRVYRRNAWMRRPRSRSSASRRRSRPRRRPPRER